MTIGSTPLPVRCKVLLVEDDDSSRAMYAAALTREGFHVRSAPDGMTALRMLESYDPDDLIGVTRRAVLRPYRPESV